MNPNKPTLPSLADVATPPDSVQAPAIDRTSEVLVQLRKAIVSGAYAAGDRLPEAATAVQLGVSRVPVREAMLQLEREGLLAFDQRGAATVRELTPEDFEEIFSLRLTLEPMGAMLASQRLTKLDVERLEANITRTRKASRLLEVTLLDVGFHDLIMRASRHSRLLRCWHDLKPQLEVWLHRMHRHYESETRRTRETTVREHTRLLALLLSGKPEDAAAEMRKHTAGWREHLAQVARSNSR